LIASNAPEATNRVDREPRSLSGPSLSTWHEKGESTMADRTERTAITTCPLCESTCGLSLTLHGDRVVRTAGDSLDVFSKGYMCPKGATLGEQYDDPDWLRRLVVREGNTFREVSWDEAFQRVDELMRPILDEEGPAVTSVYYGNPNGNNFSLLYLEKLLTSLGTRNLFSAVSLDQRPKEIAVSLMYGSNMTVPIPDIDRTDHLVVIGANPMVSNGSLATAAGWPRRLRALRRRGATLVVIDPVRTLTADLANQHVQPLVGSDAALLASMVHVWFEEDLVRLGPLAKYVTNLDIVREAVRAFGPEDVTDYTGVAADTIRQLARDLTHAPSACVYGRTGTTIQKFGSISSWLIEILNILTGNLDRAGGAMFPLPASGAENTAGRPRFGSRPRFGRYVLVSEAHLKFSGSFLRVAWPRR
jgi:anaerobic selenocysteine-containing dehydrogenase